MALGIWVGLQQYSLLINTEPIRQPSPVRLKDSALIVHLSTRNSAGSASAALGRLVGAPPHTTSPFPTQVCVGFQIPFRIL